ncbi:MAG: DUF2378 family protein [Candidatus Thermoplasmatota archaeon]
MELIGQKGAVLKAHMSYIRQQWGTDGLEDCSRSVGISFQDIRDEKFYPKSMDEDILRWISARGMEHVRRSGAHAVSNLGALAYVVRFMDIRTMLRHAEQSYFDTFNYGGLRVLYREGEKSALVEMTADRRTEEQCTAWLGVFQGILSLTRTKGTVEHTRCVNKGDTVCEYRLRWA